MLECRRAGRIVQPGVGLPNAFKTSVRSPRSRRALPSSAAPAPGRPASQIEKGHLQPCRAGSARVLAAARALAAPLEIAAAGAIIDRLILASP
jgi:hypothetical protein